jgi:hypothetical protein
LGIPTVKVLETKTMNLKLWILDKLIGDDPIIANLSIYKAIIENYRQQRTLLIKAQIFDSRLTRKGVILYGNNVLESNFIGGDITVIK